MDRARHFGQDQRPEGTSMSDRFGRTVLIVILAAGVRAAAMAAESGPILDAAEFRARVEAFNRATHVFKVYFQAFFNGESDLVSIIKKFNATEEKDAGFDCTGLSPLILQRAMDIAGNLRTWSDKPENSADFLKVCLGFLLRF